MTGLSSFPFVPPAEGSISHDLNSGATRFRNKANRGNGLIMHMSMIFISAPQRVRACPKEARGLEQFQRSVAGQLFFKKYPLQYTLKKLYAFIYCLFFFILLEYSSAFSPSSWLVPCCPQWKISREPTASLF